MVDSSKCVYSFANCKSTNGSVLATGSISDSTSVGVSTLQDIENLVWIMCFYWHSCQLVDHFFSCLLWDLTSKVASTPKVTIVVDLVEIVGCYVVEMLVLSKRIFAFFWLWTLRLWWTWYFLWWTWNLVLVLMDMIYNSNFGIHKLSCHDFFSCVNFSLSSNFEIFWINEFSLLFLEFWLFFVLYWVVFVLSYFIFEFSMQTFKEKYEKQDLTNLVRYHSPVSFTIDFCKVLWEIMLQNQPK